ncbi:membrane protein [Bacteroidales bacterium]|nr:membrane protein [Bacteroidales bacterium]
MKKGLIITGSILLTFLVILIILPFAFRGKLVDIVKKESNEMLTAKLDFKSIDLSFLSSFPQAKISLKDFYIVGTEAFANDTLVYAGELSISVNLKSFFGDTGYEVSKVELKNGSLRALVLEDGRANWDIMKVDSTQTDAVSESDGNFKLLLQQVSVKNTNIYYKDDVLKTSIDLKGIDLKLKGDMTADVTEIETEFFVEELNYIMDKIPYLYKARAKAEMKVEADIKNMKFTFSKNEFKINEILFSFDGWLAMLEDESMDMDIKLNAPSTQFKDVLSMVPALYAKDFKDIKTSGEATLSASIKGKMTETLLPAFDVRLMANKAMFQYPSLPKAVTNIAIRMDISNPGGSADNTLIDISKFHFEIAGNPFDITLKASHMVSDATIALSAIGHLDLDMIKEVYPLEDMEMTGKLDANLKFAARMSAIEKEQYEKVNAEGSLKLKEMLIKQKDQNDVHIKEASMTFNPRNVDLNSLSAQIGENDIQASGHLENFIPYVLKNDVLRGNLNISSNYLNLNDFMSDETATSASANDSSAMAVIEIPKNLDFKLDGKFKKVLFDNMEMENVAGQLAVKDGKVDMKNVIMNTLGGSMIMNGYYDTSKNPKQPEVSFDLNIKNASFAKTFSTFVTVQKFAPIFESSAGTYSTNFKMTSPLGPDLMPLLNNINAEGLLLSNNLELNDVPVMNMIASSLKNDSFKHLKIKDLNLPFSIHAGRVNTKPFDINFNGGKMNLAGSTGLDQTISYTAKIDLSDKMTGGYLKKVNLSIGGTFSKPTIGIDTKDIVGQIIDNIGGGLLGGTEGSLTEKAGEEMSHQIENIRKQAKETGDRLIEEADKQGQNLINEAKRTKNPLAKAAAEQAAKSAAKKLNTEAQKKASQLNEEAEKQIQSFTSKVNVEK